MNNATDYDFQEKCDFLAPEPELIQCDACGKHFPATEMQPVDDGTATALICCVECAAIPQEADCTCRQVDVDLYDAAGCELHNPTQPEKPWPPQRMIPVSAVPAKLGPQQAELFSQQEVA